MTNHTIKIENYDYSPRTLKLQRGDTVVWENADDMGHTATRVEDPRFETGLIRPGQRSAPIVMDFAVGTYSYICRPHPFMTGELVIE